MRKKITIFAIICICFLLQSTIFQRLSFAGIVPNLMIVVVSSFGFMNGKKEGLLIGFVCGLLIDIFFGFYLGIYALIYMYVGYINGVFSKHFYPDDIKLPMAMIGGSDLAANFIIYFFLFLFRGRFYLVSYLTTVIIPEFVYTMIVSIFVYYILLKINQHLQMVEKRRTKKFEF